MLDGLDGFETAMSAAVIAGLVLLGSVAAVLIVALVRSFQKPTGSPERRHTDEEHGESAG